MAKVRVTVSDLTGVQVPNDDHVVIRMSVNGRDMEPLDVLSAEVSELLKVAQPRKRRNYTRRTERPLTEQ